MPNDIIPFGKYKGQPVEVLAADKSYTDWLMSQDWFRERYQGMYTLIVNNFSQPQDTPEHNSIQALFLDDEFCLKFVGVTSPYFFNPRPPSVDEICRVADEWRAQEQEKLDGWHKDAVQRVNRDPDLAASYTPKRQEAPDYEVDNVSDIERVFEIEGVDVIMNVRIGHSIMLLERGSLRALEFEAAIKNAFSSIAKNGYYRIEIKPDVGDDYPTVLRQMRANKSNVLVLRNYTGVGATADQFQKIMRASEIKVIFLDRIERYVLPTWLKEMFDPDA